MEADLDHNWTLLDFSRPLYTLVIFEAFRRYWEHIGKDFHQVRERADGNDASEKVGLMKPSTLQETSTPTLRAQGPK